MVDSRPKPLKVIVDREKASQLGRCPACGGTFAMGETAVLACGAWEGEAKFIHENDAVFDAKTNTYVERRCYEAQRGQA